MKRRFATLLPRHLIVALAFGALCLPAGLSAQQVLPGKHPEFLHALSDLRSARGYLDKVTPNDKVDNDTAAAIREIDSAINGLKQASVDDGKDLHDHPAIDAHLEKTGRLNTAKQLLEKAYADVKMPESDAPAAELQKRILGHINEAHKYVDQAIAAKGGKP
jgi:hypothetical protein